MALATEQPTRSEPTRPGPWVTAMPSKSLSPMPAASRARLMTGTITSVCRRDASSGTTPPYGPWTSSCEATMLDRILRPPSRTAAAVSSQEVSIPRTIIRSAAPSSLDLRRQAPSILTRQLGDPHEPEPPRLPARGVLAQEARRAWLAVGDHDHLTTTLRPRGPLRPARPLPVLAAGGVHRDLTPRRAQAQAAGLVIGDRQVRRVGVDQEEPPRRQHLQDCAHARPVLREPGTHVVGDADYPGQRLQVSADQASDLLRRHGHEEGSGTGIHLRIPVGLHGQIQQDFHPPPQRF